MPVANEGAIASEPAGDDGTAAARAAAEDAVFGLRRVEARVLLNLTLIDEHDRLEALHAVEAAEDARQNRDPVATDIKRQIAELEDRMTAEEVVFVLQGIGSTSWLKLCADHPPTRPERLGGRDVHDESFRPAAVLASLVEVHNLAVTCTESFIAKMFDVLPLSEAERLWAPVLDVNVGSTNRPKSLNAFVYRQLNGQSSTTAPHEGSLAASS